MKIINIYRATRLTVGVAAISLLACALPMAIAQGNYNNNNGGNDRNNNGSAMSHQGGNNGGNGTSQHSGNNGGMSHQNTFSHSSHSWNGGQQHYHQQGSQYPAYNGPEHRKYYTYGGSQFYLNVDTGIRIKI
jgi:hypothetical protein